MEQDLYKAAGGDRLMIHLYYKMRVKRMEREQGTSVVESTLLDSLEFLKNKYGKKFNTKNYSKYLAEKCNFSSDKLYSGLQKRRAQRGWAKRKFLESQKKSNT